MPSKKSSTSYSGGGPTRVRIGITDKDMGWAAFKETVNRFVRERPDVVTGIFGDEAARQHQDKNLLRALKRHASSEKRKGGKGMFLPTRPMPSGASLAFERYRASEKRRAKGGQRLPTQAAPSAGAGGGKGLTNAELGAIHEFGLGKHIPMRSFLRSTFDLNKFAYQRYVVAGMRGELIAATKARAVLVPGESRTLKRLALKMEGDVKQRIGKRQITPPNAASTIRRKKSSTPLIDTGQLRRAITSTIRTGGPR